MVEVSEIGLKEEELELDLGLSIGGCFRKSEKSKSVGIDLGIPFVSRSNSVEVDLRLIENQTTLLRSSASSEIDSGNDTVDLQTRREIQALRRQAGKNKQQEKICRGRNSVIENAIEGQRASKREKTDSNEFQNNGVKNANLNMCNGQTENYPVHYNYPPVQFVPYKNGFAYPFLMPCWNSSGIEKNRVEPANCQGIRPFLPCQSLGLNGKPEVKTEKTTSNGSPICSSSSVSDHLSSSHEGGGTSDTGTNSSCSFKDQQKGCKQNATNGYSEQSACSPGTESAAQGNEQKTNYNRKVMPKLFNHLNSIRSKEETTTQTGSGPLPFNKSRSTREALSPSPLRAAKVDCGKPPKPQAQNQNTPTLPQMPYVSTTGNGPNGTTVTGLLYKYTKSEVCIVCICHGSTFSPAEFVQHAGGNDITNPLKHITVIPS